MTFYAENEIEYKFDFDWEEVFHQVAQTVLDTENCPYEAEISLLLTDNEGIRQFNKETRNLDQPTDVLSFPNIEFEVPADFLLVEEQEADYFEPDTGELILGDIIISAERMEQQASDFGHSIKREFAFLIAHSMLHLCGYDHMEPEDEKIMIAKQEAVLKNLNITRE